LCKDLPWICCVGQVIEDKLAGEDRRVEEDEIQISVSAVSTLTRVPSELGAAVPASVGHDGGNLIGNFA